MDSQPLPQNRGPLPQPESVDARVRKRVHNEQARGFKIVPFVKEVARRFGEDNGSLFAAALSFFTLLSMVPVLLMAVTIFARFMKSAAAQSKVIDIVSGFLPAISTSAPLQAQVHKFLSDLVDHPNTTIGIVAFLGLVWSTSALFLNMEVALDALLHVKKQRGFIKARLVALGTMALLGALLLSSIVITAAMDVVKVQEIPVAGFTAGNLPFIWGFLGYLIPVALSIGMFFAIYKIVPNARIESKAALVAAIFAAVFFEFAKQGFGWYVGHFGNFNKMYGTLGTIVFLVTWILYSFTIMIVGAEIADVYSDSVLGRPVVVEQPAE